MSPDRERELDDLLRELGNRTVSEKAEQALTYAARDAQRQGYAHIYDDNVFAGLLAAQTGVGLLLRQHDIDADAVLATAREPIARDHQREDYRTRRKTRYVKKKDGQQAQYESALSHWSYPSWPDDILLRALSDLPRHVDTADLFVAALTRPGLWQGLHSAGLSPARVRRNISRLQHLDPGLESQRMVLTFDGKRYAVDTFDLIDIATLDVSGVIGSNLFRVNLLTPQYRELRAQIDELEWLINRPDVTELAIQRFFEAHPSFLLGVEHKAIRSQLTLARADGPDLRPDFFMERIDAPLMDIAELKLPSASLVVSKVNRTHFTANVTEVMAQLRQYFEYFNDIHQRRSFNRTYGLDAYKPRLYAIIGRTASYGSPAIRQELELDHPHVRLLTYDDVIARARQSLSLITSLR